MPGLLVGIMTWKGYFGYRNIQKGYFRYHMEQTLKDNFQYFVTQGLLEYRKTQGLLWCQNIFFTVAYQGHFGYHVIQVLVWIS